MSHPSFSIFTGSPLFARQSPASLFRILNSSLNLCSLCSRDSTAPSQTYADSDSQTLSFRQNETIQKFQGHSPRKWIQKSEVGPRNLFLSYHVRNTPISFLPGKPVLLPGGLSCTLPDTNERLVMGFGLPWAKMVSGMPWCVIKTSTDISFLVLSSLAYFFGHLARQISGTSSHSPQSP